MNALLEVSAGWLGYLERPSLLVQLLAIGLVAALVAALPSVGIRLRGLGRNLVLLGGLLAALLPLAALGCTRGLVLLAAQGTGLWVLLEAIETLLLRRLLPPDTLRQVVSRLLRPGFLLLVLLVLLDAVGSLDDLAAIPLGTWFGGQVDLGRLFTVLVVLYLVMTVSGLPSSAAGWLLQRGIGISTGSRRATELIVRYLLVSCGILWALGYLGFDRTGVLAVAGGLSVGLGFGVKEIFANFISGVWLLLEGSVRPGEVLIIEGQPCSVRRLGLRATTLWRTTDNAELVIPNQTFFTATTATFTGTDRTRCCSFLVGAAYRHPPSTVIALLVAVAADHPAVLSSPPPSARLNDFGDSAIEYKLSFTVADPMAGGRISSDVRIAVWEAFDRNGIEMPYPHQVQLSPAPGSEGGPAAGSGGEPPLSP